jgi:Fe-S oxidoreductase
MGRYLRDLKALYNRYNYQGAFYGHLGDGCVHTRITFDLETKEGIKKYREFILEAADLVVSYGGSLSGEHGDGQSRGELLPKMFGEEMVQAFREFKSIWDPDWKMNPGKVINPYRIDENLRLGENYKPAKLETNFSFSIDNGNFASAALRCVGVGECRRNHGGTMCPSYRATMEEQHSTRGRARLLFEMIQGEVITDKWKSEYIKEALDLCLACKGCKTECPVNVDMATYKAEFLSHYYKGKARPVAAYSMGLIHRWANIGSLIPGITNFITQNTVTSKIIKAIAGIAAERSIPKFAPETFQKWFKEHNGARTSSPAKEEDNRWAEVSSPASLSRPNPGREEGKKGWAEVSPPVREGKKGWAEISSPAKEEDNGWAEVSPPAREALGLSRAKSRSLFEREKKGWAAKGEGKSVLLWADTFNNHFHTNVAIAATEVLEHLGYEVIIPPKHVCCGRPLYDYGMLSLAKKMLVELLEAFKPWIDAGTPIVGLEPSCLAVIRDEMMNFFPDREDAKRLRDQSFTLAEFLETKVKKYNFPALKKKAVIQSHCHEKAVLQPNFEIDVLKRLGLDVQVLDEGCCGMAGSFGFRKEHYNISQKVGENTLLPLIRTLDDETLVIADGFSCQEQILQGTGKRAYHLAEVLRMSLPPIPPP